MDHSMRLITNPVYSYKSSIKSLNDEVIVYNDGKQTKVVPVAVMERYPIIHDKYYENDISDDISLTFCPFSSAAIIYFGKWKWTGEQYNNSIIIQKDSTSIIQLTGKEYKTGIPGRHIVKDAVLLTLREVMKRYNDCVFLDDTRLRHIDAIVPASYRKDQTILHKMDKELNRMFPAKQLVIGIDYISSNSASDHKYTCIVSKTPDKIHKYIDDNYQTIKDKSGIIINVYWFVWSTLTTTKVIEL